MAHPSHRGEAWRNSKVFQVCTRGEFSPRSGLARKRVGGTEAGCDNCRTFVHMNEGVGALMDGIVGGLLVGPAWIHTELAKYRHRCRRQNPRRETNCGG